MRPQPLILTALAIAILCPTGGRADHQPLADPASDEAQPLAAGSGETYQIQAGDTLSGIARDLGLSTEMLLLHNPQLQPDRIRVGQRLRLGDDRPRVNYRIRPGDTFSAIRSRFRVSREELMRWNPGLKIDRIRAGARLVIYSKTPPSTSQSVGTPSRGRLLRARALPRHSGYLIRSRSRAWGTLETVTHVVDAFDAIQRKDSSAPRIRVHDISNRHGGRMTDHRSHQSGRDVDMAYFHKRCEKSCAFRRLKRKDLDAARQWQLLKHWLERDQVEAVFIDYGLQPALYQAAKRDGASKHQLQQWFQYPSGRTHPVGIVRHYPKHADHLHVRFHCHASDPDCKTFRPLLKRRRAAR